ncbi:neuronal pentraxin receptor b [Denticeps clupeoides]|uniref:Pentraxin (PTX) domain-containing protein n=1 Tax=Denticeps clupeoides TaxID=299321 RepID=A0AAY4A560_9TELE|nr:neuronal pentraxin receptor-like [Denticeps clupeoides]XP_028830691.1 neuronal pentraxin receptor-like [Denticeps clupeoides]
MKFVVVLVAAGLLAFLGAVICIIASVSPRSGRTAPHGPADNLSLSESLLQPLSTGAVAHAGPLGALHGSGSYEGGLGVPDLEVPAFNELNPGEVTGAGRKQFTFSRLICTPIPIGDCKARSLDPQADGPYSDDDWNYLRITADELRQAVMRQNNQIVMDQRTIGELTSKLAECESGLEESSLAERSVGAWTGGSRRLMAGDDVSSSAAAQLQTARAVEELETAILQLKDRIEKLEAEIGPASENHTDILMMGSSGSHGNNGWQVENLEGQLEKKMKQLEKERKAMRKEAQNHHKEINEGLDTLQNRISELEQSLTDFTYPKGYRLSFPVRTNYMYGTIRREIPEMYAFTVCVWLKPTEAGIGTPFSYAVSEQPNELVLLQGIHKPVELLINDKVAQLPLSLPPGIWQHICVSWTLRDGKWKAYQGGTLRGQGEGLAAWHPIRPGGVLILGQEQDSLGGRFDASQALVGELSQFNLWDRILSPLEVARKADCSASAKLGNVSPWTDRDVDVFGGATKEPVDPCAHTSDPQQ